MLANVARCEPNSVTLMENEARVGQLAVLFELSASETVQGIGSAGRQVTEEELPGAALHKEVRARMERLSRGVARILGTPKEFLNASVQFLKLRRHFCRPLRNRSAGGRDNAVGEKTAGSPPMETKGLTRSDAKPNRKYLTWHRRQVFRAPPRD